MKKNYKVVKISSIIITLFFILITVCLCFDFMQRQKKLKEVRANYTMKARAAVVGYIQISGGFYKTETRWLDEKGTKQNTVGNRAAIYGKIGDSIDVLYNPVNSKQSVINISGELEEGVKSSFIYFLILFTVSLIFVVRSYLLVKYKKDIMD